MPLAFRSPSIMGSLVSRALGAMYYEGHGVTKDYVHAHMLWNLAAAKGDSDAAKFRDYVAGGMTQGQIAEAQKLARECEQRNYKNCD